jgi:hypothetical protein
MTVLTCCVVSGVQVMVRNHRLMALFRLLLSRVPGCFRAWVHSILCTVHGSCLSARKAPCARCTAHDHGHGMHPPTASGCLTASRVCTRRAANPGEMRQTRNVTAVVYVFVYAYASARKDRQSTGRQRRRQSPAVMAASAGVRQARLRCPVGLARECWAA